jgi:pimeloyl-ACP methyl ester carboxylesterase
MRNIQQFLNRPASVTVFVAPMLFMLAAALHAPPAVRFNDVLVGTGIRMRYASSGDSLGEPVIFLHGLTDSWFSFSEVLPRLNPRYAAFALDQRGHGGSERPDSGYAMRDFASDVVAFMDAMKLKRATIVGHSMGTLVAREVATKAPDRVARLVLIGAPATGDNQVMRELNAAVLALGDSIPRAFAHEFQVSTVHTPIAPAFLDRAISESMRVPPRVWRAALAGIIDPTDPAKLKAATFPTLIVRGEKDAFFLRPEQELLVRMIPNARLVEYASRGHAPHWEDPAQFVRDLERFLARSNQTLVGGASRFGS